VSVPKQHAVLASSIKSCLTHIETMIETHSAVARKPAPPLPTQTKSYTQTHHNHPNLHMSLDHHHPLRRLNCRVKKKSRIELGHRYKKKRLNNEGD
jgi:hypothetical protein